MRVSSQAAVPAATGAFLSYVVVDFLMHAVALAPWWRATQGFWLPPPELARRIPFAYGAFALYCATLTVLLAVVHGERPGLLRGARLGALVGLVSGVTSSLGSYSVLRVPASFLVVGPASTTVGSIAAGTAAAWVLGGGRRWRRVGILLVSGLGLFVVGVVVQNVLATPEAP